ncbi:restriction endonuclease subunit S [Methanosarcina sp. 1.H.A.2.2]|uniref:restriction endonuclease subunit S n=1 Tax=Methanosarcina sp. 1.H.A.2.2 TaxID=1483601 RepID=UPI0006211809|nr:restriction endonuclease subunit S [Methanosarcina sp. 1.H.A.2.2]KKH46617.1 hypothetical protein EO93_10565 [Methanosarcina sp. 1.H.A.2.2]
MNKNWEMKRLGEISKINYGYTEKASFKEIGPRFLRITDIQENNVDWETVPFCKIEKNQLSKYLLNEGDIVFARTGATTGKSFLVKKPPLAVFASYLIRLQILDLNKLAPEFLFLFFQTKTYWDKIETGLSGSAQGGFNATKLAEISIPLPPISEQQHIVSILDETFAAIEKAKENAEKNLQNSRELFESYLQSVFANHGDGWEEKKLGYTSKINYGYTEKASFEEIGPRFLRITDIQENNVDWETVPFCKIEKNKLSKYILNEGDIVFARTGATTGKSFLVKKPPLAVFASYLIRLQILDLNKLAPEFLFLFFQTKTYWDKIETGLSGSAQGGFNATKLAEISIPLPPISKQTSIVAKLDALSAETKKLEEIYQQKLAALDELKKSVLQKAFNGELAGA